MSAIQRPGKPPKLRTPTRLPTGPRLYRGAERRQGGPGLPPAGFVGAKNSASEWPIYWALARVFGVPADPRAGPPFPGGPPFWTYQEYVQGPTYSGDTNIDFFVYRPPRGRAVAIRVQTERYHVFQSAEKQAYDRIQKAQLEGRFDVVDLYEQDFLNDASGQAAVVLVKQAIGAIQRIDPILAGTGRRPSRGAL